MTPLPALSCDAHCHVFGAAETYPLASSATYEPPFAPIEHLEELHDAFGLSRAVLVQGGCYGKDHIALLDAIARDPVNRRGVGTIDMETTDQQLSELDRAGIRGARFSFLSHLGAGATWEVVMQTAARVTPLGWHIDLHIDETTLLSKAHAIRALHGRVVIDHMARLDAEKGLDQEAYKALCEVIAQQDRWIKISGVDRVSGANGFEAGVAMAQDLFARFPEKCIWGTDWPHPNSRHGVPSDSELVACLHRIAPSSDALNRLLVQNPEQLFGFVSSA